MMAVNHSNHIESEKLQHFKHSAKCALHNVNGQLVEILDRKRLKLSVLHLGLQYICLDSQSGQICNGHSTSKVRTSVV